MLQTSCHYHKLGKKAVSTKIMSAYNRCLVIYNRAGKILSKYLNAVPALRVKYTRFMAYITCKTL